jgi:UDP-N-acetylglucosamine 2-epimerase (non-hydrolysing)
LDFGGMVMTGLSSDNVIAGISEALDSAGQLDADTHLSYPQGYEVIDCSNRVAKFMLSTISRHHDWAGIRRLG